MKRILAVMIWFSLLVACSGEPATVNNNGMTDEGQVVEIDFYYPTAVGGPIANIFDSYAEEFHKQNPDIIVNTTYAGGYDDIAAAVQTEIQGSGQGPDVAVMFAIDLYTFIDNGYIVPIQTFIDDMPDPEAYTTDFYPAFMENSMTPDGTIWSVPFQRSTPVLYYNKEHFREVGLNPDQPPQNRAELIEYGKQLTLPDGERWGILIPSSGFPYWLFQSFALANGQNVVGEKPTQIYFDHPAVVSALEDFMRLSEEGIMPSGEIIWGDTPADFMSGKASMIYHTTGSLTNILSNAEFEVGVGYLVAGDVGYGAPTGGGNLYIFDTSSPAEQEAAWRWVQYLTSPEILADWGINTGYIAPRISAWQTPALQELVAEQPQYDVARNQLQYASKELSTHQGLDVRAILNQAISRVIAGEMTALQALTQAQHEADILLQPYREIESVDD